MAYLLDADVFIRAKNLHYGMDFCPAFWDWLVHENVAGNVFSVEKVGDEVEAGNDELAEWAEARGLEFFLRPDATVFPALARVSTWATGQHYEPAAASRPPCRARVGNATRSRPTWDSRALDSKPHRHGQGSAFGVRAESALLQRVEASPRPRGGSGAAGRAGAPGGPRVGVYVLRSPSTPERPAASPHPGRRRAPPLQLRGRRRERRRESTPPEFEATAPESPGGKGRWGSRAGGGEPSAVPSPGRQRHPEPLELEQPSPRFEAAPARPGLGR